MKALLVAVLALGACYTNPTAVPGQHPDYTKSLDVPGTLSGLPGLDGVKVRVLDCGFLNAFWVSEHKEIQLCAEWQPWGVPISRVILWHEAAHAAFTSGVRFTGLEELAADEYAEYMAITRGHRDYLIDYALFWDSQNDTEDDGYDPHPSSARRAGYADCLWLGSGPAPSDVWKLEHWHTCKAKWERVKEYWDDSLRW